MYRSLFCSAFLLLFSLISLAQRSPTLFVVELTDKHASPYSIHEPWEFLSARSIERRKTAGIAITESDLPVNEHYELMVEQTGVKVKHRSKWMNSLLVIANEEQMGLVNELDCVSSTFPVGFQREKKSSVPPEATPSKEYDQLDNRYGYAANQITMLQGHILHLLGHEGQDKWVGVLDGGFVNVDVSHFFDSLRVQGRLLPCKDIVFADDYAYEDTGHGTQVLSTMGANLPGLMVGTAPEATYICIKTEEIGAENPVEEEYWIVGLEYADSLGVDVINSSLGYTTFDLRELNHKKPMLDGQTYRASRAADIAASKGMLIFNSAGNEGGGSWKKMGVPADAHDIIAVGAVDARERKAKFSSFGPTADGRIKPDLSAMGKRTAVASLGGYKVNASNGTSFSSPVLAGMGTSLWSAFPDRSWEEIKDALVQSGDDYWAPDTLLGYGIPDMTLAYAQLSGIPHYHASESNTRLFKTDNGYQVLFKKGAQVNSYEIKNSLGETIKSDVQRSNLLVGTIDIEIPDDIPSGVYHAIIQSGDFQYRLHLVHDGNLPIHQP